MKMSKSKTKQLSVSSPGYAKGGNGKMLHEAHTGAQKPGHSGPAKTGSGGGFGVRGGNGHMAGPQSVKPVKPGGGGPTATGGRKRGYGGQANGDAY